MTQEQENFYRHSTVIVDETKDSFFHLLDFHLTNQGITLQRFIEIYEHEIYHLCYNRYPCCQCPPGTQPHTKGSRVLHPPQLDIFLDPTGGKLPGHNPGSRSAPHCCCPVNPNLKLDDLDFSLARLLLVNFTTVVPQGSPERKAFDFLVYSRNHSFAHAKEGKISNSEFQKSFADIENALLVLAKVYGKEAETKQNLKEIARQPVNAKLHALLQNMLLQQWQLEEVKKLNAEKTIPECLTKDLCDVSVTEGCDAHFKITTKNDEFISLWSKDGLEIINSEKFITLKEGKIHRLTILNTCLSDQGLYTVRVNEIVRHAYLDVEEYFTKDLQCLKCIEGETAEFICEVIQDSLPARWNKNGVHLENNGKYEILQAGKIHRLSIRKCDLNDTANYAVNINNRVRATSLNVIEYFTKPLGTMTCTEGETIQFECEVLDDNQTALWFKDGTEVIISEKYKAERHGKLHRLVISSTKTDDTGEYSIKIKNCVRRTEFLVLEIPKAIQELSKEDKELYLEIIKTGTETRYYIRIVIIGENGVGKTCLLRRLLKQSITGVLSTDGIEIHRCKINPSNGQWIFNEVSDTKKTLLSRLKKALQSSTRDENPTHANCIQRSHQATGLLDDEISHSSISESPDTTYNTIREFLDSSHSSSDTKQITKHDTSVNITLKDQSSTQMMNSTEMFEVEMESHSQLKPDKPITTLLPEKVLHGLDDLLNEIGNVDVPADVLVECGILDFAGEKEYYATHPIFLNPNAIHLLVTNIMKDVVPINTEDGFDRIGGYVDFWLDTIHSCCVKEETNEETKEEFLYPPVIIVCTRIDECRDDLQERKDVFRKELFSLLRNETKRKHVREICYVSNTESGEEDFHALRNTIFEYGKQVKTFAEMLPLRWIRLEQSLDVLREAELNILSWPDIVELSAKCSIDSKEEINLFLKYQHKVGGVIYFESLKEYIILNQKWLANAFRCLVSDKFDSNLKLTDEWNALEDTGKLELSLIAKLFDKEPELNFNRHSGHLLNVMEIFGIIVKLTTLVDNGHRTILPTYYMPCMISEKASFSDIIDTFSAKEDNCKRTPWLCIEFDFMPFDFFNHILCYYINKYPICTEPHTARMAIYHGMGVFFLDSTNFIKFILCFCKNTIALQIWQWDSMEEGKCKAVLEELRLEIERVKERFETRNVSYIVKLKCPDGNIHKPVGRHSYTELLDLGDEYFCGEHNDSHSKQDFFQTWFEDYTEIKGRFPPGYQPNYQEMSPIFSYDARIDDVDRTIFSITNESKDGSIQYRRRKSEKPKMKMSKPSEDKKNVKNEHGQRTQSREAWGQMPPQFRGQPPPMDWRWPMNPNDLVRTSLSGHPRYPPPYRMPPVTPNQRWPMNPNDFMRPLLRGHPPYPPLYRIPPRPPNQLNSWEKSNPLGIPKSWGMSGAGFPQTLPPSGSGFPPGLSSSGKQFPQRLSSSNSGFPQTLSSSYSGFPQTSFSGSGFPQSLYSSGSGFPQSFSSSAAGFPQSLSTSIASFSTSGAGFPQSVSSLTSTTPGSLTKGFPQSSVTSSAIQNVTSQLQNISMNNPVVAARSSVNPLGGIMSGAGIKQPQAQQLQTPQPSHLQNQQPQQLSIRSPKSGDMSNIFSEISQEFSEEVEDEVNSYYRKIYSQPPHPTMSVDEVLDVLRRFKDSANRREKDVYNCMLRNLFKEYRFFPQYPERQLLTTAYLFGGIIEKGLATYMDLGIAQGYVLGALKKPHNTKMYIFGIAALDRFKTRLKDYPQYCQHLKAIPHFSQFPRDLIEFVEYGSLSKEPPIVYYY